MSNKEKAILLAEWEITRILDENCLLLNSLDKKAIFIKVAKHLFPLDSSARLDLIVQLEEYFQ